MVVCVWGLCLWGLCWIVEFFCGFGVVDVDVFVVFKFGGCVGFGVVVVFLVVMCDDWCVGVVFGILICLWGGMFVVKKGFEVDG